MPNHDEGETIFCQDCGGQVNKEDCPHKVTEADKINTGDDFYDRRVLLGYADEDQDHL